MNPNFSLFKWYSTRTGLTSLCLVLLTAVWLGVWGAGLLTYPQPPTYPIDFGNAKWISPPHAQSVGYFRKNLYISGVIRHAWVEVTATDSLQVFLNNKPVILNQNPLSPLKDIAALPSSCPTAIVDIQPYLQMGTNTLAVYSLRGTYTSPVRMKLRGQLIFEGGGSQEFQSDTTWRASNYPGVVHNLIAWTDPAQDEAQWPFAVASQQTDNSRVQPVGVPPWAFERAVDSSWLGSFPETAKSVSFYRDFDRPLGAHEDWLQVASIGLNMVMVNGRTVIDSTPATNIQAVTSAAISPNPSLHFYWLTPWLHFGHNHIEIRVESTDPGVPPQMVSELSWKRLTGKIERVDSDSNWKVSAVTGDGTVSHGRQALQLTSANYASQNWGVPPYLSYPDIYSATELTYRLVSAVIVGTLIAALVFLIHLLSGDYFLKRGAVDSSTALTLDALLHLPILLALLIFALLPYEVRVDPRLAVQPLWFFIVLLFWVGLRWFAGRQRPTMGALWVQPDWRSWASGRGFAFLLGAITVLAFIIRVAGINLFPVDQDEVFICNCAHGIWTRGYPSIEVHHYVYRLSTYEILPYPIAITGLIFGWTDWSVRIPALLFGTFVTLILGRMGREFFSWRVGLLAALIYALNPWAVYWGRHCFHPAQAQFFALLCFGAFYRAVGTAGMINGREYYKCCAYYILLYLTWEGTGLVFP